MEQARNNGAGDAQRSSLYKAGSVWAWMRALPKGGERVRCDSLGDEEYKPRIYICRKDRLYSSSARCSPQEFPLRHLWLGTRWLYSCSSSSLRLTKLFLCFCTYTGGHAIEWVRVAPLSPCWGKHIFEPQLAENFLTTKYLSPDLPISMAETSFSQPAPLKAFSV